MIGVYIVSSKQMYAAECNAVSRGLSFADLMEKAGNACADIIFEKYCKEEPGNVLVLCGKGKNGGDGFVISRVLWQNGCKVTAMLCCGDPKDEISNDNYMLLQNTGVSIVSGYDQADKYIEKADVIVEALFGTGFSGRMTVGLEELATKINKSGKHLVCIDTPAGASCDTAVIESVSFTPELTIAISAYKPIHVMKPCSTTCGKIAVADIGIISEDFEKALSTYMYTVNRKDVGKLLPKRKIVSNKGTYGTALCVCGSMCMPGAAYMSVSGALRTGAGLVTAAFPKSAYPALAPKLTEAVMLPLESNQEGTFSSKAYSVLMESIKKSSAVLMGCGIGQNSDTSTLTETIISNVDKPLVLDADALNIISKRPDMIKDAMVPVVITPHPGEMSRLCKKTIAEVIDNPVRTASEFATKYGCTVVLKVTNTVICSPDKKRIYINTTGNSGLAKGGSGDLLAGMIVSLLAQGMDPFDAAVCAVFMHGDAADSIARKTSMRGMLVTDILDYLPEYYGKYE